jgi:hypothetical protein
MKPRTHLSRWIPAVLAVATLASFAGTASADHGGSRRFKGVDRGFGRERVIIREHDGGAGPAIAGLIGGFILGSAVSNAHPVIVHEHRYYEPVYRYYDPFDDIWFDSIGECRESHFRPRFVELIDVRRGFVVRRVSLRGDFDDDCD